MATAKNSLVETIKAAALEHEAEVGVYQEQYKTEDNAENGPRALFQRGNELLEADEASADVSETRNLYESALSALQSAKNSFVEAVASQLGIVAQVEKPKPSKEAYEAAKLVLGKMSGALVTLKTMAEYSPEIQEDVAAFIAEHELPALARPAQDRKDGPVAPKYRVDVTVSSQNEAGESQTETHAGFTKTAQAVKNVTAAEIRQAYENAGGKGDGTFNAEVQVNGRVFLIADRVKASK